MQEGFDDVILDENGKLKTEACFDKILDLIGPASIHDTISHTNEGGIICITGLLGNEWYLNEFDPIGQLPVNGYITSFLSGHVDETRLQEMLDYVKTYHVDATPEKVFSLEEVPQAHAYLESEQSFGKVVILNT